MKLTRPRSKDVFTFLVKCGVAIAIVYWLVSSGQLNFAKIGRANLNWLVLVAALQIPLLLGPLYRWYLLARCQGLDIELSKSIHIGLIGYFASIFVPSGLGLDGSRAVYAMRKCPGQAVKIVSTLVMDRLIGLFSMISLGAVFGALLLLQQFDWLLALIVGGLWLALFGILAVALVVLSRRFARLFEPWKQWALFQRIYDALLGYREHRLKLFEGFLLTVPGHVGLLAGTYFTFVALDITSVPAFNVFALTPVVSLSNIVPLTPMGLGVSEWVAATLYARYHYGGGADANMALRLVTMVLMILCGVAMFFPVFDKKRE